MIARSACAIAPPASVAELFVSSVSPPPDTVAVLMTVAGAGSATVALTVIGGYACPAGSASGRVQVTVLAAVVHVQPAPDAELTDENCAGSKVSTTVTVPLVGRSPLLATPMVKL